MERCFGFVCVQILMCFNVLVAFISAYVLHDIYICFMPLLTCQVPQLKNSPSH